MENRNAERPCKVRSKTKAGGTFNKTGRPNGERKSIV